MSSEATVGPVLPFENVDDVFMEDSSSRSEENVAVGESVLIEERTSAERCAAEEVKEALRKEEIRDTMIATIRATEEELRKTVQLFQQLIIRGASQKDFDSNEKKQATLARALKRMKEDFEGYQVVVISA
ncbi:hypothetical protein [Absidia glauca]|uniref:Uncharacterized protein n=1 Tax=Absidia glauca TaxID=4829 RepID=A0A168M295_ABSGL|nr:hypothetical protein [Absidia glauca]